MQVRVLETFLWVARLKSFRLAAERLFLTQATVSHRIAVLEEELGVRLFVRDSKGVTLTPDGELVREHAERLVSQSHALQQAVGAALLLQQRLGQLCLPRILVLQVVAEQPGQIGQDLGVARRLRFEIGRAHV